MSKLPIRFSKTTGGTGETSRFVYIGKPTLYVLAYHKRKSFVGSERFVELTHYPRKYR